jgi:hypothetical protein
METTCPAFLIHPYMIILIILSITLPLQIYYIQTLSCSFRSQNKTSTLTFPLLNTHLEYNNFCSRRSAYVVQFFPVCVRVTDEMFKRNTGYNMTRLDMAFVNSVFNGGSCATDLLAVKCIQIKLIVNYIQNDPFRQAQ